MANARRDKKSNSQTTPLAGVRVLSLGGIWAGRVAAMLLADQGADVVEVNRPDSSADWPRSLLSRGQERDSHRPKDRGWKSRRAKHCGGGGHRHREPRPRTKQTFRTRLSKYSGSQFLGRVRLHSRLCGELKFRQYSGLGRDDRGIGGRLHRHSCSRAPPGGQAAFHGATDGVRLRRRSLSATRDPCRPFSLSSRPFVGQS
jgi:hypothetical protein